MFKNLCNYSTIRRQDNFNAITPRCACVASQASKEISDYIDTNDATLDICLSNVFSQSQVLDRNAKVDVCVEDETTKYFNRKDVQIAFNARLVDVNEWSMCSGVLTYDMANLEEPMTPVLAFLLKSGIRVFVYSGDQDSVLPLTCTWLVVNGLVKKLGLPTTLPYRAWFSDNNQVGGWTQVYGDVLHFATVGGAAHEVPYTQPE
ncbi:putative carboxypeptidase D [Helianthus annuus]|nr:putative carboxypeptidase D [Helianthus annuus]